MKDNSFQVLHPQRRNPKWYVHIADFANMLKAFIGSNYLSIAFAFHQSGLVPGVVCLVLIAIVTDHCCHMIVKCKYKAIDVVVDTQLQGEPGITNAGDIVIENALSVEIREKLLRNLSYGDVGKIIYGKCGLYYVNFCLFITQFGFCVAYFIFVGNTIRAIFPFHMCNLINSTYVCGGNRQTFNHNYNFPSTQDAQSGRNNSLASSGRHVYEADPGADSHSVLDFVELDKNTTGLNVTNITTISTSILTSTAPSLMLLVLLPLPVFIGFSYVRNVRHLGAISVWANISILLGAIAVMIYLVADFSVSSSFRLYNWAELPIFFGLVTSAFEGIGTIIPIESSMEGNRHNFGAFLHGAVGCLSFVLLAFGILGYLKFGESTNQMINTNIPSTSWVGIAVNICLCIGVILTFPLQIYPVIELAEIYTFADGKCCGPKKVTPPKNADDYGSEGYGGSEYTDQDALLPSSSSSTSPVPVATVISREVSTLKRNVMRMFIVLTAAGLAVLFRDKFAYIGAFTGAIGSSALAYILPCLFYIKLCGPTMPWYVKAKNIIIIIMGISCSVISLYSTIRNLVDGKK
ncbi:proton-coupled amino acid transporter 4-like isoform X2 [Haliotis rubra]|uniref:proton-coupled amino acid transporter 4-like isoform X2 n=1 Tax=Haliotis rubra TaxID=36100 RepID=UPI001EE5F94A|nr:proton-coupled amino acid transporter 4-like isoform X2 [Haliotis rubra]